MAAELRAPHFPRPVPIDGYGRGGFSFAEMSHRGSLLCLPSGIWAWPVAQPAEITEETLAPVFEEAADIGVLLIGSGRSSWLVPDEIRLRFQQLKLPFEVARTGTAISTYNILLGESRRVAAGFIAVE